MDEATHSIFSATGVSRENFMPRSSAPGLKFGRLFSKPGISPYAEVAWELRAASITDVTGKPIFEQKDVEVPADWSMTATNIVASKYLHGHLGVPQGEPGARETGVRQLVVRVAETIRDWGLAGGYFATIEDATIFHDELVHLLLTQKVAFNSPVWFNVGCDRLEPNSDAQNWHWNPHSCAVEFSATGYRAPQCSACFINSVEDSLDSILTLAKTEGMLFKWGSGTGTNLSPIRASMEVLSGGGTASGPLSFMRGFDAFAGVIKSGGKTRRAAKMVILNVDHPDIIEFIECKAKEEAKAWTLMQAGYDGSGPDSEAYSSIFFQNANNSVRVTDEFMRAVERDQEFTTRKVKDGSPAKTYRARDLMNKIAEATWQCGDPGMQYDTTINKWHTSKNTSRINASNPCSEYMFLDNSACNLASFNLLKFMTPAGTFDVGAYRHAVAIMITAMDILVDNSGYPTEAITKNSHDYRPLGLGYANLGALLMAMGLPYDSAAGRDFAAALTAIMCGQAYLQSSVLAEKVPALAAATPLCRQAQYAQPHHAEPQYAERGQPAGGGACPGFYVNREPFLDVIRMHRAEVNKIGTQNAGLEPFAAPQLTSLIEASKACWDQALAHGEQHGYRNSQVTVLAPTGTIGFMMDCDTTGIEPDLALVKYKKLVGGGMIKIVNNTVPAALFRLGYTNPQVDSIVSYIDSTGTIEGAPGIKEEHLAVFDCSFKPSKGTRSISPMGHVKMMAAAQPFLSGAISKTVNLPHDANVEDVAQAYMEAWRLGLKAVAIYRDGSKGAQPLNVSDGNKAKAVKGAGESPVDAALALAADHVLAALGKGDPSSVRDDLRVLEEKVSAKLEVTANSVIAAANAFSAAMANAANLNAANLKANLNAAQQAEAAAEAASTLGPPRAIRHRLPAERASLTHKFSIAGHEGYLTVGLYPNGQPGELFIRMAKEGSTVSGLMDSFATAVSLSLQHGVPLKVLVEKFAHTRFEPSGWTGNEQIGFAKSIMDYIFRWLQLRFLSGHQLSLFQRMMAPPDALGLEQGLESGREQSAAQADDLGEIFPPAPQSESAAPALSQVSPAKEGTRQAPIASAQTSSDAALKATASSQTPRPDTARAASLGLGGGLGGGLVDRGVFHAADAMKEYLDMGDAPSCQTCGAIMVRNGSCYRCMSCGSTSGCS